MNKNKRTNLVLSEKEIANKAMSDMLLKSNNENILLSDDDLVVKWENIKDNIRKFYNDVYVDAMIEHTEKFSDLNKVSIALMQRKVYTPEQIKQNIDLLKLHLETILGNKMNGK